MRMEIADDRVMIWVDRIDDRAALAALAKAIADYLERGIPLG